MEKQRVQNRFASYQVHIGQFPASPRLVQLFHLHCTLEWLFFRKTRAFIFTIRPSPPPPPPNQSWLWLVGTAVRMMPRLYRITDTHQVYKYPDSTLSKVLTVLKWRMITTLNRKLLEKQRVQNRFASYEVHIGHFYYNVNAAVSFGNRLTLSIFRFQNFFIGQTDRRTKPTLRACARGVNMHSVFCVYDIFPPLTRDM